MNKNKKYIWFFGILGMIAVGVILMFTSLTGGKNLQGRLTSPAEQLFEQPAKPQTPPQQPYQPANPQLALPLQLVKVVGGQNKITLTFKNANLPPDQWYQMGCHYANLNDQNVVSPTFDDYHYMWENKQSYFTPDADGNLSMNIGGFPDFVFELPPETLYKCNVWVQDALFKKSRLSNTLEATTKSSPNEIQLMSGNINTISNSITLKFLPTTITAVESYVGACKSEKNNPLGVFWDDFGVTGNPPLLPDAQGNLSLEIDNLVPKTKYYCNVWVRDLNVAPPDSLSGSLDNRVSKTLEITLP